MPEGPNMEINPQEQLKQLKAEILAGLETAIINTIKDKDEGFYTHTGTVAEHTVELKAYLGGRNVLTIDGQEVDDIDLVRAIGTKTEEETSVKL